VIAGFDPTPWLDLLGFLVAGLVGWWGKHFKDNGKRK